MIKCAHCTSIFPDERLEDNRCPVCSYFIPEKDRNKTTEGKYLLPDGSNYDQHKYAKPLFATDILIIKHFEGKLKLLAIKRKENPCQGMWAFPGGFVNIGQGEHPDAAAVRELEEETKIAGIPIKQFLGFRVIDPRDYMISFAYFALLNSQRVANLDVKAGDDAEDYEWIDLTPRGVDRQLAMSHNDMTKEFLTRIMTPENIMHVILGLVNPERTTSKEIVDALNAVLELAGVNRVVRLGSHLNSFLLTRGYKLVSSGEVDKSHERGRPLNFSKLVKCDT